MTLAGLCIVLGVGMDNVFVMTNAFMRANPTLSVPERLSKSYEEAAVSITLTSATNAAAFAVGAVTANYGTVYLFCVFCGWAIAAIYFFTVVMFGAVIACAALAEEWLKTKTWYSEIASSFSDKINEIFRHLTHKMFHLSEGFDMAFAVGEWLVNSMMHHIVFTCGASAQRRSSRNLFIVFFCESSQAKTIKLTTETLYG